jgi:HSP20 family protein
METQTKQTPNELPPNELPVREKQSTRESGTYQGAYFEPAVDIHETDEALIVQADVPGVDADGIETDLRDNLLTLSARVKPLESRWKSVYREYETGNYIRQFRLGQHIDQSKISAELKEGVLTLVLPKADNARPRRIQIKAG